MRSWISAVTAALVLLASSVSLGSFHLISVHEVYAGDAGHPNAQFVELVLYNGSQNQLNSHEVVLFNAAGTEVTRATFSAPTSGTANQSTILVGTSDVQRFFGVVPDLQFTCAGIDPAGGKVCFDDTNIDCMTWGNYSGPNGVGTPAVAIPRGSSLQRDAGSDGFFPNPNVDDTDDSAADFVIARPTPKASDGGTGGTFSDLGTYFGVPAVSCFTTPVVDAGLDAGTLDAGLPPFDAGLFNDAGTDAGVDAGVDAGTSPTDGGAVADAGSNPGLDGGAGQDAGTLPDGGTAGLCNGGGGACTTTAACCDGLTCEDNGDGSKSCKQPLSGGCGCNAANPALTLLAAFGLVGLWLGSARRRAAAPSGR